MKLLVDTHVLLWAAVSPARIPRRTVKLLADPATELYYSPVSLWEIVIKRGLGRPDFDVDARRLWRGLSDNGWRELPVSAIHTLALQTLPPLHRDPFDRLLLAQSAVEGWPLLTADATVASYPGNVLRV